MRRKITTLVLGLCLAIPSLTATAAFARSLTGWATFKVWMAKKKQFGPTYSCLHWNNGAVANDCKFPVSLTFDLPTDRVGTEATFVQDYFLGTAQQNTFSCTSYSINGNGGITVGTTINFTGPGQTLETDVNENSGESIQVICTNIPTGGGVANFNWAR